jgi:hypothetical protein
VPRIPFIKRDEATDEQRRIAGPVVKIAPMSEDHHHCNHFVGKYLGPWKTPLFPMLNHGQANRTLTSQSFCKLVYKVLIEIENGAAAPAALKTMLRGLASIEARERSLGSGFWAFIAGIVVRESGF